MSRTRGGAYQDFGDIVVFLRIDGDDFEIVGHREVSASDRWEQAPSQAEEATPELEALAPAPVGPEDAAAAPAAPDQLAALPSQPEATDAALSQEGAGSTGPTGGEASLEAVERLLRERREDFEASLDSYLWENWTNVAEYIRPARFNLLDWKILGREAEDYLVEVMILRYPQRNRTGANRLIVSLRFDGETFEIVGHVGEVSGY